MQNIAAIGRAISEILWRKKIRSYLVKVHWTFFSERWGIVVDQKILVRFRISSSVPETFAADVWSRPKSRQILHVFGLKNFWRGPLEILNRNYKIEHTSDNRAKFRGDRPTKHGDLATTNKKFEKSSRDARKPIAFPVQ